MVLIWSTIGGTSPPRVSIPIFRVFQMTTYWYDVQQCFGIGACSAKHTDGWWLVNRSGLYIVISTFHLCGVQVMWWSLDSCYGSAPCGVVVLQVPGLSFAQEASEEYVRGCWSIACEGVFGLRHEPWGKMATVEHAVCSPYRATTIGRPGSISLHLRATSENYIISTPSRKK